MKLIFRLCSPLVYLSRSEIVYSSVRRQSFQSNKKICKRDISVSILASASEAEKVVWGSKKAHRKVKLNFSIDNMANPEIEFFLEPLRLAVKEQVKK